MSSEQKRLLSNQHGDDEDTESQHEVVVITSSCDTLLRLWLPILLGVYSLATTALLIVSNVYKPGTLTTPFSPVSHLIHPTVQYVWPKGQSVYQKPPSEEVNDAWAELVAPMLIQASETEVRDSDDDPSQRLELVQGGYLASLGVFHELHCLRRLYWHMHGDIYFANITEQDREYERGHARHCIEAIRTSLMCQANTALYTFEWKENTRKKQHLTSTSKRECVNFDAVHSWSSERSVGLNPRFHKPKMSSLSE